MPSWQLISWFPTDPLVLQRDNIGHALRDVINLRAEHDDTSRPRRRTVTDAIVVNVSKVDA